MRISLRANATLAVAASAVLIGAAAWADDLLVMPYACSIVDGQPVLRRARDEGHPVLGRREQRNFTACSPVNPDMCRQWTVYRFDLDCDGARVPWVSVIAAAARRHNERIWLEEGRLRLDMGPRWGMSPDDPCARASRYDDGWRSRRLDRYCADRRALDRSPSVVDMPPGFAPMLGIDGIFVASGAPNVASAPSAPPSPAGVSPPPFKGADTETPPSSLSVPPEPAAKSVRAETRPPPEPSAKNARAETSQPPPMLPELASKGARIASLPPAAPEPAKSATGQEPAPTARPSIPLEIKQVEAKPAAAPQTPAPAPAAAPGGPIVPKIINRPAPPPEDASSQPKQAPPVATVPKTGGTPEASTKIAAAPPVRPKETVVPESPAQKAAARKEEGAPATLMSVVRSPATGAAIAGGVIAVVLLAAFALTRRRERVQLAGTPRRDIATVSLDGRTAMAPAPSVARKGDPEHPPHAARPSMPTNWGDRIPRTRDEALQVLGMGVTADANLSAMKKIVDGLRASWHPDHATGQADRQMRELRLKQINAAWEIIAGKRAVA